MAAHESCDDGGMGHRWLRRERGERGASPVEYALLVAFIVLALVVGVGAFRTGANTAFNNQRNQVSTWAPAN